MPPQVLYLEDQPMMRRAFRRESMRRGIPIRAVATVEEGYESLEDGTFDLVVSDFHLQGTCPDCTSANFVRTLVKRGVPVIVISSLPEEARVELGGLVEVFDKQEFAAIFDTIVAFDVPER